MRIVLTGTPGTGKSTIAPALASALGLECYSVADIVWKKMRLGARHEVDIRKLASALRFLRSEKDYIIEGHLACETKIPADIVVVSVRIPASCDPGWSRGDIPSAR